MVKDGYPYCQKCDLRMFKPKCFGCKKGIVDDYAETGEGKWHLDCFTCCVSLYVPTSSGGLEVVG